MLTDQFSMNGYIWSVEFVDAQNDVLIDRTGVRRVATTDPVDYTVYLSELLHGEFLMRVFIHELGHCALYCFGLLDQIKMMTKPEYQIDMEEFICNVLADYGWTVYTAAFDVMGYDAWKLIPKAMEERFVA